MTGPLYKTVSALAAEPTGAAARPLFSGCWLHYNGPGSSGFGVKRTAMLLPESAMLMVSPMGCGRSGSVVAERFGFSDRMFYLDIDDRSAASGAYLGEIPKAVKYIAGLGRFKAVLLCMTCIDALTGTDLAGIGKKSEREAGIRVTTTFMDPIVRDGNFGPMVQVRQAITDCFEGGAPEHDAVNVLGTFAPVPEGSELASVLRGAGIARIRTAAGCGTFEELRAMGRSRFNLVIHPQAAASGEALRRRLGMEYCPLFTAFTPEHIRENYAKLGAFAGTALQTARYAEAAERELCAFRADFAGKRVAVGEAVAGSPFEIASALIGAGIEVPFVFRDMVLPSDAEAIQRLAAAAPETKIYSGVHPGTFAEAENFAEADAAVGLDAGYFLKGAASAAWPFEETHWGFDALMTLLSILRRGFVSPEPHRSQMRGTYLTV